MISATRPAPPLLRAIRDAWAVETIVALGMVATMLAMVFEDRLTGRSFALTPAATGRLFQTYVYDDRPGGGDSTARLDGPLRMSCRLGAGQGWRYCGVGVLFDWNKGVKGIDLSRFNDIRINLSYSGRAEYLRMVMKDHDDRFVNPQGANDDKPNQATVTVRQGEQQIALQLSDFTVAEWWKEKVRPSPELARPSFRNIISVEFVTGADAWVGDHGVRIRSITFKRRIISSESFYAAIVLAWMLVIGSFVLHRRRVAKRQEREVADGWRRAMDTIPQMVWWLDSSGCIHFNQRWVEFTGVRLGSDYPGKGWNMVHPDDVDTVRAISDNSFRTGQPSEHEYRIRHRSGEYRWVLARAVPERRPDGTVRGWYGTCTDVHDRVLAQQALKESIGSERKKSEQLKWASEHDALTLLPNRRAFQARLQAATLRAMESDSQIGLLLVDIDHFKHVNDSLGHIAGDDLLKGVAERLRVAVRQEDFVGRVGGDEFAIVLEGVRSDQDLLGVGNAVFAAIQAPLRLGKRMTSSGASIGGALFPRDAATANDLFKTADTALYALKTSGRGGTLLFHRYMLEQAERAASQLAVAREALNEQTVVPYYQAKISLDTGAICGFEALLRWNDAAKGVQLPETLEEAFKDYELAAKIGELMQHKVAADVREWIDRGLEFGRVSINAAPAEFLRDDYAGRLLAVLAAHDVPPRAIEVEVTEHVFMERGREFVARALGRLQGAGMTVSLDDFGTGYSSLSHLRDFPVDRVKIDKSFIQQMTGDAEIAAIVTAVVNLARSLEIDVVAEGVETQEQLDLLRSMGCHMAQGHLFGAAADAASVAALVSPARAAA